MPTYEYACQQCGHHLELFQKMSDPAETHCPACGTEQLKRQISAVGFQLKGTGWYVTDFRDKKPSESVSETASAKTTSTAATTDAKPAATTTPSSTDS